MKINLIQTELAWAAGFFDGEGNTCMHQQNGKGSKQLRMQIGQAEPPDVLWRFYNTIGKLGGVYGPYDISSYKFPNAKKSWKWSCNKYEHNQAIIAMLWKYLSPVKREQAKRFLIEVTQDKLRIRENPDWNCRGIAKWNKGRMTGKFIAHAPIETI